MLRHLNVAALSFLQCCRFGIKVGNSRWQQYKESWLMYQLCKFKWKIATTAITANSSSCCEAIAQQLCKL
jgi:hypothetical protein